MEADESQWLCSLKDGDGCISAAAATGLINDRGGMLIIEFEVSLYLKKVVNIISCIVCDRTTVRISVSVSVSMCYLSRAATKNCFLWYIYLQIIFISTNHLVDRARWNSQTDMVTDRFLKKAEFQISNVYLTRFLVSGLTNIKGKHSRSKRGSGKCFVSGVSTK